MNIETEISAVVGWKGMVIPVKTLTAAKKESKGVVWMRISEGNYLCQNGDNAYVVSSHDGKIGCACPAMAFHCKNNDVCKHIAMLMGLPELPQKPISNAIAQELLVAGWSGDAGNLKPPQTTSDVDGEDNEGSDPVPPTAEKPKPKKEPERKETMDKETTKMEQPREITEQEKRIITEAEGYGAKDIDPAKVAESLAIIVRYRVTGAEAERTVVSDILRKQGIQRPKGKGAANQLMAVDQITSQGVWLNMKVKVTKLWDSSHESIRQSGVVGDESGTTKFTSWEVSDLPMLELNKCYSIENVVTKEWEGKYSVSLTKNTTITELNDDIEVGYTLVEFTGIMVDIQKGSGLIKRCPTCNRATKAGTCDEHGAVKGIPDLRIKGVLDNGIIARNILLNRERTEALTDITLDTATAMAMEAFDAEVVADQMRDNLIGREFTATGSDMGDTILIESIRLVDTPVSKEDIDALLKEV